MHRVFVYLLIGSFVAILISGVAVMSIKPPPKQEVYEYPTTNLFGMNMMLDDEYTYINEILNGVEPECYAVNFYNATSEGDFVYYNTMVAKLRERMDGMFVKPNFAENITAKLHNATINKSQLTVGRFLDNPIVKVYFELNCKHLDSRYDVPDDFDKSLGISAYSMCYERNMVSRTIDCNNLISDGDLYNVVFQFEGDFEKYMKLRGNASGIKSP